jgi:hypothetical protein
MSVRIYLMVNPHTSLQQLFVRAWSWRYDGEPSNFQMAEILVAANTCQSSMKSIEPDAPLYVRQYLASIRNERALMVLN